MAFQAVDDLLDVTRTSEELGKDAAHDAESGKVTCRLPGSKARELAEKHTMDAIENSLELAETIPLFWNWPTGCLTAKLMRDEVRFPYPGTGRKDYRFRVIWAQVLLPRWRIYQSLDEWSLTPGGNFLKLLADRRVVELGRV